MNKPSDLLWGLFIIGLFVTLIVPVFQTLNGDRTCWTIIDQLDDTILTMSSHDESVISADKKPAVETLDWNIPPSLCRGPFLWNHWYETWQPHSLVVKSVTANKEVVAGSGKTKLEYWPVMDIVIDFQGEERTIRIPTSELVISEKMAVGDSWRPERTPEYRWEWDSQRETWEHGHLVHYS